MWKAGDVFGTEEGSEERNLPPSNLVPMSSPLDLYQLTLYQSTHWQNNNFGWRAVAGNLINRQSHSCVGCTADAHGASATTDTSEHEVTIAVDSLFGFN